MKVRQITTLLIAGAAALQASAISLDISSVGDSGISFGGDGSFTFFPDTDGYVFEINDSDGATGDAAGLSGAISGSWMIDSTASNTSTLTGAPGTLTIWDGASVALTADVDFSDIGTVLSGGVVNGGTNLTNIMYAGANSDLMELAAAGMGAIDLSFEIAGSSLTLDFLANNEFTSTFSGDISAEQPPSQVPDSGTTLSMLGLSMLAGVVLLRKFRPQAAA